MKSNQSFNTISNQAKQMPDSSWTDADNKIFDLQFAAQRGKKMGVPETMTEEEKAKFDEKFAKGANISTKTPESYTELEKAEFDYEFSSRQNKKNNLEAYSDEEKAQFDRVFAHGGIDKARKIDEAKGHIPESMTDEEKAQFDEEFAARQKKKIDIPETWSDEEKDKFDKTFERGGAKKEKEFIRENLQKTRATFAKKKYENNKAMAQIKKILRKKDTDSVDPDMIKWKEDYTTALDEYKQMRLEEIGDIKDKTKKIEQIQELYVELIGESVKLRDERMNARTDGFGGKIADGFKKVGGKLFGSKIGKKVLLGVTALGVVTGSTRVILAQMPKLAVKVGASEGGIIMSGAEKVALASKFLAPIGAGVGAAVIAQKLQDGYFDRVRTNEEKKYNFNTMNTEEISEVFAQYNYNQMMKHADKLYNVKNVSAMVGVATGVAMGVATGSFDTDSLHDFANEQVTDAKAADWTPKNAQDDIISASPKIYQSIDIGEDNMDSKNTILNTTKITLESDIDLANSTIEAALGESVISQSGEITAEQIQAVKELPVTDRDVMEEYLIQLNKEGVEINGKTVNEILQDTTPEQVANIIAKTNVREVVDEISKKYEVPKDWVNQDIQNFSNENTIASDTEDFYQQSEQISSQADIDEFRSQMMQNTEFHRAWAGQMQEIFSEDAKNIANTKLSAQLADELMDEGVKDNLNNVIKRAKNVLGQDIEGKLIGEPGNEATVQGYFSRIFAEAVRQDKIKDIFPSSKFKV